MTITRGTVWTMRQALRITAVKMTSRSSFHLASSYTSVSSHVPLKVSNLTGAIPGFGNRYFAASRTVKVPSMGDSITEGSLNEWKKYPGDYVGQDEVVAIIDTDKVSIDINAPASGTVVSHLAKPGDTLLVGADLFVMEEGGERKVETAKAAEAPQSTSSTVIFAPTPSAPSAPSAPSTPIQPPPSKPIQPSPSKTTGPQIITNPSSRTEERVPMNRIRKRIAERLKSAQNTAASLTTFQEVDMGNLMAMRSELGKEFFDTYSMKIGFVSAFLFSASRALMKMPQVNAYISEAGDEIIYKNYADISVAVATPTGLLVPVIRDCQRKGFAELESDLVAVAQKARDGKIALEDMVGGTFTISNGGIFGSLFGTPILNPPQSSILGLHSIKDRPVAQNGEVVIRPMMYLALTYDHRIVDGREAVLFLNRIKNGIEDPRRLILDV